MKRLTFATLISLVIISACTPATQPVQIPITETGTSIPIALPTLTFTPIPTITETPSPTHTPTITPTFDPIRNTPPTIMLHRPSADFDSIAFLKDLLAILKQNNMEVITYRDISNDPAITTAKKGKLFIITIDDISLTYPMHKDFHTMIDMIRETGYPAVLGVVTETDYADPDTAALLKELSNSGWEIATHTNQHANLGEMEKISPRYVFTEVSTSMDKIEKVTGIRPITLILPEGQMVNNARFIKRAKVIWCVGINGGNSYDSTKDFIYVGREGPDGTAEQTFENMRKRFGF